MKRSTKPSKKKKDPLLVRFGRWFAGLEFSKQLAVGFVGIYLMLCIVAEVAVFIHPENTADYLSIIELIGTPIMVVVSGYFGKAGYENGQKIKSSHTTVTKTTTDIYGDNNESGGSG